MIEGPVSRSATELGGCRGGRRFVGARFGVLCAFALIALLALVPSAQAARGVLGVFGEYGEAEGQFWNPSTIDAYMSTGDLYVADAFNVRLQRFDADGNFELAAGWGVDDGSDEFQICTSDCQAAIPGAGDGQFAGPSPGAQAIAVDQSDGSVFVNDPGNRRVQKFDKDGNFLLAFGWGVDDGAEELQTCTSDCQAGLTEGAAASEFSFSSIAVDPSTGHLLAGDPSHFRVLEYDSEGHFVRSFGNDVVVGGGEGFEVCTEAAKCKPGVEPTDPTAPMAGYGPTSLSVDSDGTIYGVFNQRIEKFEPSGGTLVPSVFAAGVFPSDGSASPQAVAVVRATDDLAVSFADYSAGVFGVKIVDESGAFVESVRLPEPAALSFSTSTGRGYALTPGEQPHIFILDELAQPEVSIDPVSDITATSATAHGTINPQGAPTTRYRFEYMLDGSGEWQSAPEATLPEDTTDHPVSAQLGGAGGLEPNSLYHVRLRAFKPFNEEVLSPEVTFTTPAAGPIAETVGTTHYSATSARLEARVNARNLPTTYYFEYGPTTAYGTKVPAGGEGNAGSASTAILIHEQIGGLEPGTTYHYRVVASNAAGTTVGGDRTVTTRASDAPLTHGHVAGPPDSDRGYEQVTVPDSGGNPSINVAAYSVDGNRAVYSVIGGAPASETGTQFGQFFAERTPNGWKSSLIWPNREEATERIWLAPYASPDLSQLIALNWGDSGAAVWHFGPGVLPKKLFVEQGAFAAFMAPSEDLSTIVKLVHDANIDPAHPGPPNSYLYDIADGSPEIVTLTDADDPIPCGVKGLQEQPGRAQQRWVSADGTRIFFPTYERADCTGSTQLFMRDRAQGTTTQISGPAVSGPDCSSEFIKSTGGSAFFYTKARLVPEDVDAADCGTPFGPSVDGDIYRYDIAAGDTECVTCLGSVPADIQGVGAGSNAIADDGSRLYFESRHRLVEGEGLEGAQNIYRLNVATGDLKFVAILSGGEVGDVGSSGESITPDGSVITFRSGGAQLNALTGSDNQGFAQFYRYDDRDRSLTCVSCPPPGKAIADVAPYGCICPERTVNDKPISDDGNTYVFQTSSPLVAADQNSAKPGESPESGEDIYEWRDGRLLLITDGEKSWSGLPPYLSGITGDGKNVFFSVSQKLTPDAVDAFQRVYDARIGGGFEFPPPEPPCPLEICQGEAKGAPAAVAPSTSRTTGPGNVKPKARRKHRRCVRRHGKKICHKPHHKKRHSHKAGGSK